MELLEHPEPLNTSIDRLRIGARVWARLPIDERIAMLGELRPLIVRYAKSWVDAAAAAKGLEPQSPLTAEEWVSGPYALLYAVNRYIRTLESLHRTGTIALPGAVRTRADGQVIAPVFPVTLHDRLLLSGVSAEVWMQPGVRADRLRESMGRYYRTSQHEPNVSLVLGAGNIAAIPALDVLHKLIAEGSVCILKMNPINEYLTPIFKEIFSPFIQRDFLEIVTGAADVGRYLTDHQGVDDIHMTGSSQTHDAIVFGSGDKTKPRLNKPVSSELGNVSPTIVMPGNWTKADLRFQAEHIVTQKMHNGGFNCIALQVLILPQDWKLADAFVAEIETVLAQTTARAGYYSGAAARQRAFVTAHRNAREYDTATDTVVPRTIVELDAAGDHEAFRNEVFCSAMAITRLPGDAAAFLQAAVNFANDRLYGTLGANILIDPATEKKLGTRFEDEMAKLRYGCIAINAWSGVGFLLAEATWGAYPGHRLDDIQSGIGNVHNTFLFDEPQKTVIRAAFRPFPRGIPGGEFGLLPRPPWFVTNTQAANIARKLLAFEYAPSLGKIPSLFASAIRG
ncbi:MAG: aldehyde dehydrogenase family protein [Candidatus Eremiobacteraeota bacterium]|nr:aldehyde dehydrogenase family protein [Candidatus Eremiobacteraeota bacterium]